MKLASIKYSDQCNIHYIISQCFDIIILHNIPCNNVTEIVNIMESNQYYNMDITMTSKLVTSVLFTRYYVCNTVICNTYQKHLICTPDDNILVYISLINDASLYDIITQSTHTSTSNVLVTGLCTKKYQDNDNYVSMVEVLIKGKIGMVSRQYNNNVYALINFRNTHSTNEYDRSIYIHLLTMQSMYNKVFKDIKAKSNLFLIQRLNNNTELNTSTEVYNLNNLKYTEFNPLHDSCNDELCDALIV